MLRLFNKRVDNKKEAGQQIETGQALALKRQEEERCEQLRKEELARLEQLDIEARKTLQGDFKERYLLAKKLGMERQAEIARIEGITNTTYIDLQEEEWVIRKAVACKLGYSVGGKHYNYPDIKAVRSTVDKFPGKMHRGAMLLYQQSKNQFDEVRILHMNIGSDPTLYGVKKWKGEILHFRIMTWE